MHRILPAITWMALVLFAYFGPPLRADWQPWVMDMMMGQFEGTNPIIVAHFYCMGLWPVLLLLQLRPQWLSRPVPALPFALGAFALGAFALLPWLVLRSAPSTPPPRPRPSGLEVIIASLMGLLGVAFVAVGFALGDPSDWLRTITQDNFIWTMSADFLVLWAMSVALAREQGGLWVLTLLPLAGTAAWCCTRPRLTPATLDSPSSSPR